MIVGLLRLRQQRCRGRVAALQKVTRAQLFFSFFNRFFLFLTRREKGAKKRITAYFFVKSLYFKSFVGNYTMHLYLFYFFLFIRA
jgi:hypothetical protein